MTASFVFIRAEKTVLTFLLQPSDSTVNCFCPFYPSLFCMCIFHQFDITLYIFFPRSQNSILLYFVSCIIAIDFLVDNNVLLIYYSGCLVDIFCLFTIHFLLHLSKASSVDQSCKGKKLGKSVFTQYCKRHRVTIS